MTEFQPSNEPVLSIDGDWQMPRALQPWNERADGGFREGQLGTMKYVMPAPCAISFVTCFWSCLSYRGHRGHNFWGGSDLGKLA